MGLSRIAGRCAFIMVLAILFDIAGIILLLLGIFAHFSYWDFLIYSGAAVLALSVVLWILWYTFNVEVSYEELKLNF
ncbi:hypothetical protein GDO78_014152 [Eleutherodactylus coqui]|uniref:Transmembrane protein 238 n=1 Tax=Eleutherodactylus coqui TaxID=57060 RepID=A0A8J6EEV8_ELECQ|nr:hypothetical protein GDO78_014152 [Eleutherodactylus coqui]